MFCFKSLWDIFELMSMYHLTLVKASFKSLWDIFELYITVAYTCSFKVSNPCGIYLNDGLSQLYENLYFVSNPCGIYLNDAKTLETKVKFSFKSLWDIFEHVPCHECSEYQICFKSLWDIFELLDELGKTNELVVSNPCGIYLNAKTIGSWLDFIVVSNPCGIYLNPTKQRKR